LFERERKKCKEGRPGKQGKTKENELPGGLRDCEEPEETAKRTKHMKKTIGPRKAV